MTLFDSLFKTLIKLFSADAKECFSRFESNSKPFVNSEEKIDEILESIFVDFPESNFNYQKIIEALTSFASTDPVSILSNMCDRFINELNRTDDEASEILTIHFNSDIVSNFYFFHFVHHLNLTILTDLIKILFIHFPNKQLIQKVVTCGYKICASSISDFTNNLNDSYFNPLHTIFSQNSMGNYSSKKINYFRSKNHSINRLSKLKFQLIKSWSIIFHHISKISMNVISFSLEQYSDYVSSGYIFTLVSKVYADPPFIELLLYTLQNCQKRNQIKSEMLTSLTSLFLIVKDISEKVLVDFFTVAWSLQNHPNLKEEAIELICVLFNRLPKFQSKAIQFYNSKIYLHADDDKKVKRSAKAFLYQIRGDVSKLNIEDENPQFFNSTGNPPNDSFAVIFIKTFFERSNFNVCIHLFGQILAHLASIDILAFERIIVPNFAKLDFLSPRFASMAVALNIMNSTDFLKDNLCKSTEAKINEINSYFKQKIIDSFAQLNQFTEDKYMVLTRKVLKNSNKIDNADQIIIEFISNNCLLRFRQSCKKPKVDYIDGSNEKNISLQENEIQIQTESQSQNETKNNENQNQNELEQETKSKSKNKKSNKRTNKFRIFNRYNNKNKNKENENQNENENEIKDQLTNEEQSTIETEESSKLNDNKNDASNFSSIADLIRVIPCITDLEILKKTDIVIIIIRFMCHYDKEVSNAANEVYSDFMKIEGAVEVIVNQILSHLMTFTDEVTAHCLYLLFKIIKMLTNKNINDEDLNIDRKKSKTLKISVTDNFYHSIEIHTFCSLVYDSPFCRSIAFNILKHLSLMNVGFLYKIFQGNSAFLNESFNKSVFLLKDPFNLSHANPIIGKVDIENVCCSRFNELWLFYLSSAINLLMGSEKEMTIFITNCGEIIHDIFFAEITNFTRIAASIIYINSLYYESNLKVKENKESKIFNISSIIDFDSELNIKESQKIKIVDFGSILGLINSNNIEKKKKFIRVCSLLNWRIMQRILPELLSVENELYSYVAQSFVFLIRNSFSLDGIITSIFPVLVKFLKLLQNYFQFLDINSTREIVWDETHLNLLKKYHDICINYCILTTLIFESKQLQIKENILPLIYRQVQLKFLFHWSQLPTDSEPEINRIQNFSVNTLVLIINSGPVFIEGFLFESNFFDLMVRCEMNGNQVLYNLLNNQISILLGQFVKNSLIRTKEENQLFLKPILYAIDNCNDSDELENHVGSLILLSILLKKDKYKSYIIILSKIESLFSNFIGLKNENDRKNKSKTEKYLKLNILKHFEFATEQIIESGLNILLECKDNINLFKSIVESIQPLFTKIHILPTKRIIIQGVPSKYQIFTCVSFFNLMFKISESLDEYKFESFSLLWYEILRTSDNNSIVLILLFENPNSEMKALLFSNLLDKNPAMITDFLSKRCTFAYWYFMKTQKHQSLSSITWIIPILTRSFTYFFDYVSQNFIDCLHFSFIFIEESKELFEVLLAVFRFESVDSDFVWTSEGPNDISQAFYIIKGITSILSEQNPNEIIKWSHEAIRWSIACNDIETGYRSLYILRVLQTELPQSAFPLFSKAVSYHLSSISENNDDQGRKIEQKVSKFIGECFIIFYRQMKNSDFATFAFRFASLFLRCNFLEKSCLKLAMPIFIACTKHMVLMSTAKKVLVDAFLPFLPDLESNAETQQVFAQIADVNSTPELFLVAAAFLRKNLPFISFLTEQQIKEIEESNTKNKNDENKSKESEENQEQNNEKETKNTSNENQEQNNETETKNTSNENQENNINKHDETQANENNENKSIINDENKSIINDENKSIINNENKSIINNENKSINDENKSINDENKSINDENEQLDDDDIDYYVSSSSSESEQEEEIFANEQLSNILLSMPIKPNHLYRAMKIFGKLLYTSSFSLTDSILDISSLLLTKYKDDIDGNVLIPIFLFALKNISSMKGAKKFTQVVLDVNPRIIHVIADRYSLNFTVIKSNVEYDEENEADLDDSYEYEYEEGSDVYFDERKKVKKSKTQRPASANFINLNMNINMNSNRFLAMNEGTIENRKKMIEKIRKELTEIDELPADVVPITNCNQLSHLNGMIDQSTPPKISPFAPQLEMVMTVMKEEKNQIKRTHSHNGLGFQFGQNKSAVDIDFRTADNSIFASPSSPILKPAVKNQSNNLLSNSEKNLKLDVIPTKRKIIKEFVGIDDSDLPEINQFIVDQKRFLELKE